MKKIFVIVFISNILIACNLDTTPISTISVDSFWKTEDDAKAGVDGMYSRLRAITGSAYYQWGASRSEELSNGVESSSGYSYLFENRMDEVNSGPDWRPLYTVINDANSVLKFVSNISFTKQSDQNKALAEAYAMRAFTYFILAKTWGDVPLVVEPVEKFNPSSSDAYKGRDKIEKVFELIKNDIEKALELFGSDNSLPTGRCYWSKPAVNALKGEVYLWTGKLLNGGMPDIQTALSSLQEIQEADVQLLPIFNNVFRQKGNKEVLFAINYVLNQASNNYANMMYIRQEDIPADAEATGKNLVGIGGGNSRWAPSVALRSEFVNDDTRKNITFAELWVTRGGNRSLFASVAIKYKGIISGNQRHFLDDIILYRYADVLLMIAEAKNALEINPADEINLVRQRAYGSRFNSYRFFSGTKEENDIQILRERKLELALEGKRWWDLIRFNKVFEMVPTMAGKTEGHFLFPISQETLSYNHNLEQNEAYKK
jgi:hypothetical protein